MLVYRVVHRISSEYPLAVFWTYVGAFLLAFLLMFVHPAVTILLLWLGLVGLVFVVITTQVLHFGDRWIARSILDGGGCPACGQRMQTRRDPDRTWTCVHCEARFLVTGEQREIHDAEEGD